MYQNIHNLILQNTLNINSIFIFQIKNKTMINYLPHIFKTKSSTLVLNKPTLNRYINFNNYFKTSNKNVNISYKPQVMTKDSFYNLFLIYLQYTTTNSNPFFTPHTNFKHLFLFSQYNDTSYLNLSKIYLKWTNTCNLIINLFHIKTSILLFTIKTLKNEALSFNWSTNMLSYNLFKYASPIFFMKDTTFGITSTLIFKKFHQKNLNTVFLTDLKYHEKNLYYFKRFNITTIGLVPYNLNPWLITYAIPTSSNSLFIQYFFTKILTYFKQYSLKTQFNNYKQIW